MTGPDEPLRWERDSADEDFEATRAAAAAGLDRWAREQRLKPLTDAMQAAGMIREHREGSGRIVVPGWWPEVEAPAACCPRCQSPAAGDWLCDGCRGAQHDSPDPDSLLAWWASLSPPARRLHLAAAHGVDPWSGQPCRIEHEQTTTDLKAGVGVSLSRLHSVVPHSSLDQRRRG